MKINGRFTCGHEGQIELSGSANERDNKAAWMFANHTCKECYQAEQQKEVLANNKVEIVEMTYGEYKNNHATCKTVAGSYNKETKTIKVYIGGKGNE